ncbi:MAG: AbrB/MazE/SpoVT family DNA-binding domain-containing protein [Paenibacillus dendritiformis]|uniref:AbrB/MazE/SpoVT family DNA-binding domain-containing protein n=1 Tax=uncultured Paenibacillus sp. TaxID=227322 RepID=UPI0025DF196A|nr:AbrB/MazE/SpoVT family DNA-binding domain-containing protein [uncultured Paenibacillus sp.]MDU5141082.1 AbrB/MazE/SpoVT family DNA-binding domain-containing protein [Paenibacillus dendritiformis]
MKFNKRLSRGGGITLPAAIRRQYGLEAGEKFGITVNDEDGTIMLQRSQGQCLFCQNDKKLIVFHGRFVCAECVQHMDADVSEREFSNSFEGRVEE